MNIAQALSAARQHLVEGGGAGPTGALGRIYLRMADDLLKLGIKADEEIETEVFNVEEKGLAFVVALKAKIEAQRAATVAVEANLGSTPPDAGAVQPLASEGNPLASPGSGVADSSTGPTFGG